MELQSCSESSTEGIRAQEASIWLMEEITRPSKKETLPCGRVKSSAQK